MKKAVLGLHLGEHSAQALLLESDGERWTLDATAEWNSTLFNYAGDDTPGVDEFVDHLSTFLSHHHIVVQNASVALDTSLLFMNTLPVDDPSAESVIEEQIAWELNEYFPGSPANSFISDYHVMVKPESRSYSQVLAVSVRRDVVQKIHRSMSRLALELGGLDGDQFGAESALHLNHPDAVRKTIGLVGVKHERLDVSVLRHGELESYAYNFVSTDQDITELLIGLAEHCNGLESIMLFGERLDKELIEEIRAGLRVPVEVLNPFRTVTVATPLRLKHDPTARSFRYVAAIGVALRET